MKKLLISSTNNPRTSLWEPIIKRIGGENIYVCSDGAEMQEELIIQGIPRSNIFSTEAPFYSMSVDLISGKTSKHIPVANYKLKELETINRYFGTFAHQACRLIIGNASTQELHTIYIQTISYWKNLIRYYGITNVFFSQVPHTGGDYCLYVACQLDEKIRIKTGHPICRSKVFIESEDSGKSNEFKNDITRKPDNYSTTTKVNYLTRLFEETEIRDEEEVKSLDTVKANAEEPDYIKNNEN